MYLFRPLSIYEAPVAVTQIIFVTFFRGRPFSEVFSSPVFLWISSMQLIIMLT